jgi:replicative DNA helicase
LRELDKLMGGLQHSDLIVLAGRPAMGKTSLATNIAYNIAQSYQAEEQQDGSIKTVNGGVVGFFSLEMSANSSQPVSSLNRLRSRLRKSAAATFQRLSLKSWPLVRRPCSPFRFMSIRPVVFPLPRWWPKPAA